MEKVVRRRSSSGTAFALPSTRGRHQEPHWTLRGKRAGQEYRTPGSISHGMDDLGQDSQCPHFRFSFVT